ncbi:hypothetical protein HKX48_007432 [Thoreauomyces humboldtii]|nr:hypothetical protein HKX48_007432 [Thoreauomyces humboldtii]
MTQALVTTTFQATSSAPAAGPPPPPGPGNPGGPNGGPPGPGNSGGYPGGPGGSGYGGGYGGGGGGGGPPPYGGGGGGGGGPPFGGNNPSWMLPYGTGPPHGGPAGGGGGGGPPPHGGGPSPTSAPVPLFPSGSDDVDAKEIKDALQNIPHFDGEKGGLVKEPNFLYFEFMDMLYKAYFATDNGASVRRKIGELQQKGSVEHHNSDFRKLTAQMDPPPDFYTEMFE